MLDYQATPEWASRFETDSSSLVNACGEWWEEAAACLYEIEDGGQPDIPQGFGSLTQLLVLWCDTRSNIDARPLQAYSDQLYARRTKVVGGGRPMHWQPFERMEATLSAAIAVCRRIDTIAQSKRQTPVARIRNDEPSEAEITAARAVLEKMPAKNPSVAAFRKELKAAGVKLASAKHGKILRILKAKN